MELMAAIGEGPVALDSTIFIYLIEEHPRFLPLLKPLFTAIDRGDVPAVTSVLTLLETLVVPYRSGNRDLAAKYEAILANGRGLTLIPIPVPLVRLAAQIRATTAARTPDAVHLASALMANCTAFLTNDRRIPSLGELKVLQLEAFASAP